MSTYATKAREIRGGLPRHRPRPKKDGGEMHADMAMFMAAGTEATAMVLSRMTSHLLRTPRALALLTKGILARFARSQDVSVDGLAGLATLVSLNPYLAFTHPNNWARPTEFILERWLHPEDPEWKDDKRDYVRALLVRAENLHLKGPGRGLSSACFRANSAALRPGDVSRDGRLGGAEVLVHVGEGRPR
ncbi:uncharacterized protein GLRG_07800 [Colletotrichum graminicola M1.001]|uniref:Uncharacterized protein n=1 Tax=Colletotrichum graminicola (strain M1.001 / M2 / FGSC 10212) TaxID=645133 RepID=E3QP68_COLGM|nr:uncharacterized protein GLRG_07800 [Colletotrichum graminicola M1.001]EFQ32656.1 hypothetical protein GLRG_07800 [Colletotrichum graminicola M1.001]